MIITISGMPGSGKSTVGRVLAKQLGYRFYSMGDLRGKMAMDRGMTIEELNELGKREAWTDHETDMYQERLGKTEDDFVIDSWAGFHFIPQGFKVFLDVDLRSAAARIFKDQRPDEKPAASAEEMYERLMARVEDTDARFKKYYNFSFQDRSKFDLTIDTTHQSPEEVVREILTKIKA